MSSYHKSTDGITQSGRIEPSYSKQTGSLVSVVNEDGNNSSTKGTVRTLFVLDLRNTNDIAKVNSYKDLDDKLQKITTSEVSKSKLQLYGPPEKSYNCPNCKETYAYRKTLNEHILQAHKGSKGYKCNICGRSYVLFSYLQTHKAHHDKDRMFRCDECGETFTRKFHLSNHKRAKHLYEPAVCEFCGKHFKKYSGLHNHQYIHHSKDSSSCMCDVCGKSFIAKGYLINHMVSHKNQNIPCDICKKIYPHKRALQSHIYFVHNSKKRYICSMCGKEFKYQSTLRNHIQWKHKNGVKPKCHICDASFSQKAALKTHMKIIHIGLTPHACKHCKQEFKWKPTCEKHELKCLEKQEKKEI